MHAVCARYHGVKFMVAAPMSTVDPATPDGAHIEIEQRPAAELLGTTELSVDGTGIAVYNPVFDITPANLVDVLVTEKGVIEGPDRGKIAALFG